MSEAKVLTPSTPTISLPSALQRRVVRDIVIMISAVVVVALVVVAAVLWWGIGGVVGIAVATVVVGAVKEIGAVLEIRYAQAIESLQLLAEPTPKVGRLTGALRRLGLGGRKRDTAEITQSKSREAERMKVEAAQLIAEFDRRGATAAEWSSAAGLILWVLGLGAVATAALQLLT